METGMAHKSITEFNKHLRESHKSGVVEKNIHFDAKQARFRVKIGSRWVGSFYTLKGAQEAKEHGLLKARIDKVKADIEERTLELDKLIEIQKSLKQHNTGEQTDAQ